jgi:prophage regulatory protein
MTYEILRPRAAWTRHGLARSTFYARIAKHLIPKPFTLGGRAVGILAHELDAVISAFASGKSQDEIRQIVRGLESVRANLPAHLSVERAAA